jgi:hypothetical protein
MRIDVSLVERAVVLINQMPVRYLGEVIGAVAWRAVRGAPGDTERLWRSFARRRPSFRRDLIRLTLTPKSARGGLATRTASPAGMHLAPGPSIASPRGRGRVGRRGRPSSATRSRRSFRPATTSSRRRGLRPPVRGWRAPGVLGRGVTGLDRAPKVQLSVIETHEATRGERAGGHDPRRVSLRLNLSRWVADVRRLATFRAPDRCSTWRCSSPRGSRVDPPWTSCSLRGAARPTARPGARARASEASSCSTWASGPRASGKTLLNRWSRPKKGRGRVILRREETAATGRWPNREGPRRGRCSSVSRARAYKGWRRRSGGARRARRCCRSCVKS